MNTSAKPFFHDPVGQAVTRATVEGDVELTRIMSSFFAGMGV